MPQTSEPPFDLDAHVREIVAWHFSPATGSPYWLQRAATLGFDPLGAVAGFADLARFPAVADEWRTVAAVDLIPRGSPGPYSVWETGGTTGTPRRIVDAHERMRGIIAVNRRLQEHGFCDDGGDWLHVGPSGPHLVGTSVSRLARLRGGLCHSVDLDPRWVRRLHQSGRPDEARRYVDHIVDQALAVLRTQPVRVLATTPPLLQALCERAEAYGLLRTRLGGIIWFGTSLGEEALRLWQEELLPDVCLVGWYGNTLAGIACQRPRGADDAYRCIFSPPSPAAVLQVVDPAAPERAVAYHQTGRVRLSVLSRELFLPHHLERDQAVRVPPATPGGCDDLARVQPLPTGDSFSEGVY